MVQNKIEIYFTDKDHVWINGRQYISLGRVGQMLSEKHKTNADKIRAMTDEELAERLADMHDSVTCPNGGAIDCQPSCKRCWLDWLRQEVDDD